MTKTTMHIFVGVLSTFLLLTLADLIPFWMPMMGELLAVMVVALLLVVWGGFVLQEQAVDEREVQLKLQSGRIAYLSGLAVLLVALVTQGVSHAIDPWIAIALAVMVMAKLAARLYLE